MVRISRRQYLQLSLAFAAAVPRSGWSTTGRPKVGAIRWDAWYDPEDGKVARAMETALGPARYHDRMPFFGRETGQNSVRVNGDSQEVMDQEVAFAANAGLNYWAFVAYPPDNPMSNALHLYLSSSRRGDIEFCVIGSVANGGKRDRVSPRTWWELQMMGEKGYTKVLNGRPLYYVLAAPKTQIEAEWGGVQGFAELLNLIRATAKERNLGNPYAVLLGGDPATAIAMGFDAIGAYAVTGKAEHSPYKKLTEDAKARWGQLARSGLAMVPTAMTGWDQRPLIENPPSWDLSYMKKGVGLDKYYQRATPAEIARHLEDAISWTEEHRAVSPANTVLVYAWNECGEGFGALIPTYQRGNALGDTSRLDAVAKILKR